MIPGEYLLGDGEIELNEGLQTQSLSVANTVRFRSAVTIILLKPIRRLISTARRPGASG